MALCVWPPKLAAANKIEWLAVQQSTFTSWCNAHLKGSDPKLVDLVADLDDGVILAILLERLTNRRVSNWIKYNPKDPSDKLANLKIVLNFIRKKEKIHLVNIGPKDILAHNQVPILGLIWKLILKYQIQRPTVSNPDPQLKPHSETVKAVMSPLPKTLLLNWLQAAMPDDQPVKNLTSDWNDGQRLSALVDAMKPGTILDFRSFHPEDALTNTERAMDVAKFKFDIPKLIEPKHVCAETPDEQSMMTYLSYFCSGRDSPGYVSLLTWVRSKIPEYNIVDFTGDWRDGRALSALVNAVAEGALPNHASLDHTKGVENVRAAMKTATDELDEITNNITPEEFADKNTGALAMMGYIEWYRKATRKDTLRISVVGPGIQGGVPAESETYLHVKGLASPGSITVKVTDPDGQDVAVSPAPSVTPHFHTFRYVPINKPGKHTVSIAMDGVPISGSPFLPVFVGKGDASKCVAEGPGLLTGKVGGLSHFTVDCHRAGPGELKVDIRSPSGTDIPITFSGTEKFDVVYTPSETGPHNIVVLFADHHIKGSPFTAIVMDPSKVIVEGLCDCKTGETVQFQVQIKEAGPGMPDVIVQGPTGPILCTMEDVDDHVYQCTYTPVEAGPHTIGVRFAEEDVPGSPFTTTVSEPCYPDQVTLLHLPQGNLKVGHQYSITADATNGGKGTVSASLKDLSGSIPCSLQEAPQKIYNIMFVPTKAGKHELEVLFSGTPVPDSPVSFHVVDPSGTLVTPPTAGVLGVFITDQPYKYHVKAPDTAEKVTARAHGSNTGEEPTVSFTESDDGEYDITLTAAKPDDYDVDIYYGSDPVPGSPYHLQVVEKPHPDNVQCGPLLPEVPVSMNVDISRAGAGKLAATCKGDKCGVVSCVISDAGPGKQQVFFDPPAPDVYWVSVYWNDTEVPRSPFRVNTIPTDASKVVVDGPHYPQMHEGPVMAVCDVTDAGDGDLTAVCYSEEYGEVPVQVSKKVDGKIKVQFIPQGCGHYKLNVMWQDDDVPGSPFFIVLAPKPDPTKSILHGFGLISGTVGGTVIEPYYPDKVILRYLPEGSLKVGHKYTIIADATSGGNGTLSASLKDPSAIIPCILQEDPQKVYSITFLPTKAGMHVLEVLFSGTPVPDSPVLFNVVDPSSIQVTPPTVGNLGVFITDQPYKYHVRAPDMAEKVTAQAHGCNTGEEPTVSLTESDDGEYDITLTAAKPDDYDVDIYYGSDPVPGSPYHLQVVEKPHPDCVRCDQLVPEVPVSMNVDISRAGAGKLTATCKGDKCGAVPCTISDAGPGKQQVSFDPPAPDVYWVSVYWNDTEVPRSPLRVNTIPTDARKVVVDGPHYSQMHEGPVMAVCDVTDAGDGDLTASCCSKEHGQVFVQVFKKVDGKVKVQFIPPGPGQYTLNVMWHGNDVPGSPFHINLDSPKPSLTILELGKPFGIIVPDMVADEVYASAVGDNTGLAHVNVQEDANTRHQVLFQPLFADDYTLSVMLNNNHMNGSPFRIKVLEKTTLFVNAEEGAPQKVLEAEANKPINFVCSCGPIDDTPVMKVSGPNGPVHVEVSHADESRYIAHFQPEQAGEYQVSVKSKGKHLKSSPYTVVVSDPSKCFILPGDLEVLTNQSTFNQHCSFRVSTLNAGSGSLDVTYSGPAMAKLDIEDKQNGIYLVVFAPSEPGKYSLDVTWNNSAISGSPYDVIFTGQKKSHIVGLDLHKVSFWVGKPRKFKIDCEELGEGVFDLSVEPPSAADIKTRDLGKMMHHITLLPEEPGQHQVSVTYNNEHILGSPFLCTFSPK